MTELQRDLQMACITRRFRGYWITLYLIPIIVENEWHMQFIRKELLYPAAEHFHTTVSAVDRNLRTIVDHAWARNPDWIQEMAVFPLDGKPSVAEFLEILATRELRRREAAENPLAEEPTGLLK